MDKDRYIIPNNFLDFGTVLNGRYSFRNFIEGILLALLGMAICNTLPVQHGFDGIQNYIICMFPPFMLGAVGIQGEPLSVFIYNAVRWMRNKKPSFYNYAGKAFHMSAAELLISEPTLRDIFADKVEDFASKLRKKEIEYVEGENYEFSDDPEMIALEEAEKKLTKKNEEKKAERIKQEASRRPTGTSVDVDLDIRAIAANVSFVAEED